MPEEVHLSHALQPSSQDSGLRVPFLLQIHADRLVQAAVAVVVVEGPHFPGPAEQRGPLPCMGLGW